MGVVRAQAQADSTPSTPVKLFEATADCVVNVFCVNPDSGPVAMFVEVRLGDAAQTDEQLLVPGGGCPSGDRIVEGPIYLAAGDAVYCYAGADTAVFSLFGQAL